MKRNDRFLDFMQSLDNMGRTKVKSFLEDYGNHIDMPKKEEKMLVEDAKKALLHLAGTGVSLDQCLERLSSRNLGGFYAHEALSWYPLDDAAKVYPLSMKFGQMPMFRLSCYLREPVVPEILQIALDFTIKRFPSFATVVKKGFFWHYLDTKKRRYPVTRESAVPCQTLKISAVGTQSFRIVYYENRISAEFFHVLTDGHGGMVFLKTLVAEYLQLLGEPKVCTEEVKDIAEPARTTELSNDFGRFCPNARKSGGFAGKAALQMSGRKAKHSPCRIVHLVYDTQKLVALAHEKEISITTLMLTLMFLSHRSATDVTDGTIQIQVPVDMRKFFASDTVRNFSMYCSIDISASKVEDFSSVSEEIASQLKRKATFEEMSVMMSTAHKLVQSLKFIPLTVKTPVAKVIYGFLGDSRFSNTLSNIGSIRMPQEYARHILGFDFVLGTCVVSRASCSMCSFNGNTVFSISKNTKDPSFEERLVELSRNMGLDPSIWESPAYE